MNATPDPSTVPDSGPDTGQQSGGTTIEPTPTEQFRLVFAIYAGWSALAWLSQVAGATSIAPQAAKIVLFGIGATNALFFTIARSNALHRPPADTITLAQCVVGIAWTTLFAFMSSGAGELIIGIYASIVLFAMLRVKHSVLNQITAFAVISYSVVSLIKMLSTEPPSISPSNLVEVLIFAGIMLCLSGAGRHIYLRHSRLEAQFAQLRTRLREEHTGSGVNSVNRRYILDLLAREKGRTDRSNVPFCICIFNADHLVKYSAGTDEAVKMRTLLAVEAIIRTELRDMDSLNSTGFHNCFGAFSDREFIAILPQTNLGGARRSAERVLATVSTQHDDSDDQIRLCGGLAEYRRGETISALLARAENALGEARSSGTSRVCGSETPETRHAAIVRLETHRR